MPPSDLQLKLRKAEKKEWKSLFPNYVNEINYRQSPENEEIL
jgi:hypothetical protein